MSTLNQHFRGNEAFAAKIVDLMDRSDRQHRCIITPFFTPSQQEIAKKIIGHTMFSGFYGGYEQAEMKRFALCPYEMDVDFEIVCLRSLYQAHHRQLRHPDILGALLHLGIERDQFGDLIVDDQSIMIIIRKELSEFVCQNLRKIASCSMNFAPYEGTIERNIEFLNHQATISSKRLDCIVAACIHSARTKAEKLIKGKCVKVDHLPLEDCKYLCNNICTVSIRGHGRFHVVITERTSRKGRLIVEIGKYQ